MFFANPSLADPIRGLKRRANLLFIVKAAAIAPFLIVVPVVVGLDFVGSFLTVALLANLILSLILWGIAQRWPLVAVNALLAIDAALIVLTDGSPFEIRGITWVMAVTAPFLASVVTFRPRASYIATVILLGIILTGTALKAGPPLRATVEMPPGIFVARIALLVVAMLFVAIFSDVVVTRLFEANRRLDRLRRKAEQANTVKSRLMAALSHDLRSPLALVVTSAEVMLTDPDEPPTELHMELLGRITEQSYRLLNMIDDLLDTAQLESGPPELKRTSFPLADLVQDSLAVARMTAGPGKHIEFIVDIPADLPPITADEIRMQRVLNNLLVNAVKFTHEGSVTVRARADSDQMRVEVLDTGPGITPGMEEAIFEPYRRDNTNAPGSGLGLAIVREFVTLHGGQVSARNRDDRSGTIFTVTLPLGGQ
jgi:signal transduction histidine kinase